MTLDEYIAYEKEQLDEFQRWWVEQQEENPQNFPDTLFDLTEWFEQYCSFTELESY